MGRYYHFGKYNKKGKIKDGIKRERFQRFLIKKFNPMGYRTFIGFGFYFCCKPNAGGKLIPQEEFEAAVKTFGRYVSSYAGWSCYSMRDRNGNLIPDLVKVLSCSTAFRPDTLIMIRRLSNGR